MVLNVKQDCLSALILRTPLEKGLLKAKGKGLGYPDKGPLMDSFTGCSHASA